MWKSLYDGKRIMAPCKTSFNEGKANGNYFDNYINEFWNKYSNETLVFKCGAGTFRGRVNDQSTLLHYTNPTALVLDLKW
ncbi:beta-1,3-glucanase family protein [uncultured Eubacterium sp.]|uniref:beta-1,3-glucanase family protein n=1 Tax=uncultured Eubacterium sp. TaxID=165185 RepID=UPI002671AE4E|nr:beta-1,3-glucanase family protein [uncultured Eubacterium sp.]